MTKRIAARIIAFLAVILAVCLALSAVMIPNWKLWNQHDIIFGFYQQPKNSIQVALIGTSSGANGYSPIELYEQNGICAYNLSTSQQPMMVSKYWIEEFKRCHPESLSTVVLDASSVYPDKRHANLRGHVEKAIVNMKLSPVKFRAIREMDQTFDNCNTLEFILPVLRYHSRWDQIDGKTIAESLSNQIDNERTRGLNITYQKSCEDFGIDEQLIPNRKLTDSIDYSEDQMKEALNADAKAQLDQIVEFCKEQDINLVLVKLPKSGWNDLHHDTLNWLASEYGVNALDLNTIQAEEEMSICFPLDYIDPYHPNINGATKISQYIGNYVSDNFDFEDVRENEDYGWLAEEAAQFQNDKDDGALMNVTNLDEYLSLLDQDRYSVYVATQGNVGQELSDEARNALAENGFESLSQLQDGQAYSAALVSGKIVQEGLATEDNPSLKGTTQNNSLTEEQQKSKLAVKSRSFSIKPSVDDNAVIRISGKDRCKHSNGINIVVFDDANGQMIDSVCFDASTMQRLTGLVSEEYKAHLQSA